ncbi:hypothetical protein BX600DRAFT_470396 [Xylariales sp. PMI_506]|nr:hypothetical protein BX600DRAFT_470396 [Xylariales sp. PMI_506]
MKTTRKSARLYNASNGIQAPPISDNNGKGSKKASSKSKTPAAKSASGKVAGSHARDPVPVNPSKDSLSSLPPEVLVMVLNNIQNPRTMSALGRTSRRMYAALMPRLYGRISVAAMFHAHIPKLIRTLEPHMTIAQKKQLKKEGKYKGQQERYRRSADENAKPICATHVRQLVVGVADPGKKHKYIVDRYVEEAIKNMNNLQILETWVFTKSIGESLESMPNLRALRVCNKNTDADNLKSLANLKNMKHLYLQETEGARNTEIKQKAYQSMLLNSTSTLRSLVISANTYSANVFDTWAEESLAANGTHSDGKYDFTALELLSIAGLPIRPAVIKSFQRAFDFMRLKELEFGYGLDKDCLLFPYLTRVAESSARVTDSGSSAINLRKLSLSMSYRTLWNTHEQQRASLEAKCRFISAFDTLTTLELSNYGQYPRTQSINPGLSEMLLQAILKHKMIKTLRIYYRGIPGDLKIPYLSAETVGRIIDGLPQLQEFEFAPEEEQVDEIGAALARGSNLTSITCYPHTSRATYPPQENPGYVILSGILKGFLISIAKKSSVLADNFVWEEHYKLKNVSVTSKKWEIASKFGKGDKNIGKPEPLSFTVKNETYQVLHRDIGRCSPVAIHVGYDPTFSWVEKVARDLD